MFYRFKRLFISLFILFLISGCATHTRFVENANIEQERVSYPLYGRLTLTDVDHDIWEITGISSDRQSSKSSSHIWVDLQTLQAQGVTSGIIEHTCFWTGCERSDVRKAERYFSPFIDYDLRIGFTIFLQTFGNVMILIPALTGMHARTSEFDDDKYIDTLGKALERKEWDKLTRITLHNNYNKLRIFHKKNRNYLSKLSISIKVKDWSIGQGGFDNFKLKDFSFYSEKLLKAENTLNTISNTLEKEFNVKKSYLDKLVEMTAALSRIEGARVIEREKADSKFYAAKRSMTSRVDAIKIISSISDNTKKYDGDKRSLGIRIAPKLQKKFNSIDLNKSEFTSKYYDGLYLKQVETTGDLSDTRIKSLLVVNFSEAVEAAGKLWEKPGEVRFTCSYNNLDQPYTLNINCPNKITTDKIGGAIDVPIVITGLHGKLKCKNTPERYSMIPFGKTLYALETNCDKSFSTEDQMFIASLGKSLKDTCGIPKDRRKMLAIDGFRGSFSMIITASTGTSWGNISKTLTNMGSMQMGSVASESLGCGYFAEKIGDGIYKYVTQYNSGESRFVSSCSNYSYKYNKSKCNCIAKIGRSIDPNIHKTTFNRHTVNKIVKANPFIGMQMAFTCGL